MGEYSRSTTDFYTALEVAGYERFRNSKGNTLKAKTEVRLYGRKLMSVGVTLNDSYLLFFSIEIKKLVYI